MSTGSASRETTNGHVAASRPGAQPSSRASPSASRARGAPPAARAGSSHVRVEERRDRRAAAARARARATRVAAREPVELGPRRLGVDVVDRHRRDAAPVVDAGVEQPRKVVVGQVRRRLHVTRPRAAAAARPRSSRAAPRATARDARPSASRASRGSSGRSPPAHGRARSCSSAIARSASSALRPGLADPDQDPGRERDRAARRRAAIVSSRARRQLVRRGRSAGRLRCREPLRRRLEHDPHRRRHRPQQLELAAASSRPG